MSIFLNLFFVIAIFILLWYPSAKTAVKKMLLLVGIFASLLLTAAIVNQLFARDYILEITANNDQNPNAEGSEIWLTGVLINGEQKSAASIFSEGWISKKELYGWRSYDRPAEMRDSVYARFQKEDHVELQFQSNKWRGKATIRIDQEDAVLDFYKDTESQSEIYTYTPSVPNGIYVPPAVFILVSLVVLVCLNLLYRGYCCIRHGFIMKPDTKQRILWIDCLKVCSAFMIILIHSSGTLFNSCELFSKTWWRMLWINSIPRFAVPCFLMITGYLYMNRQDTLSYSLKQAKRIAIALFFWSCVYIVLRKLLGWTSDDLLLQVIRIPYQKVDGHLWYGYQLVWIFLLLPFWQWLYHQSKIVYRVYFIGITLFFPAILDFVGRVGFIAQSEYAPFATNVFYINYIGFLFLGGLLHQFELRQKSRVQEFAVGAALTFSALGLMAWGTWRLTLYNSQTTHDLFGETRLPAVFYGIGVFLVFHSLAPVFELFPNQLKQIVHKISKISLGIYFSHQVAAWCLSELSIGSLFLSKAYRVRDVLILVCIYFVITVVGNLLMSGLPFLRKLSS